MELNSTIPYSKETEALVLGTLINNWQDEEIQTCYTRLDKDCFDYPFHQHLYQTIQTLVEERKIPDIPTLYLRLQKTNSLQNYSEWLDILNQMTNHPYQHVEVLLEISQRRKLAWLGLELYKQADNENIEPATLIKETAGKLNQIATGTSTHIATLDDAIQGMRDRIEHNHNNENPLTGTPTGFTEIDQETGGLQASDLIVIAADTSQGKTSLALKFTLEAARTGAGVAIYSLEMKKEQLAARMIAVESNIRVSQLLYKPLTMEQIEQVETGLVHLYGLPVYFDDRTTSNIDTILASIRGLKVKYDIKGAVVDYLQILSIQMKGSTKEAQIAEAARRLKNLAHELNIWIIAVSQLNRDAVNPVPSLNRLRDSGQIGEAADMVILIYRPEIYNRDYPAPYQLVDTKGTAQIDIAKGRNTGLSKFICSFTPPTTRFTPLPRLPQKAKGKDEEDPF